MIEYIHTIIKQIVAAHTHSLIYILIYVFDSMSHFLTGK